jgi:CHAD domain-containing protein
MREVELKLAVHGSFVMPPLSSNGLGVTSADELPPLDMRTTYYDTRDLQLARNGITLRYRRGEDEGSRWTLKLPVDGEDATVHEEVHFLGSATKVPEGARDLVTAFTRSAPIGPVAAVRTRRRRWSLRNEAAEELAEVVDDEVSVLEGRRVVGRFREIEIEGRSLDAPDLEGLAAVLEEAGATAAEPIPKAVRAMGSRATAPPDVVVAEVAPRDSAGEAVRAALASGVKRLVAHDPGVRLGKDIEAVHQMRVAARRLRSDLRTFEPLVSEEWAASLVEELRWLGGALGAVRDLEVQRERFQDEAEGLGDRLAPLLDDLDERHQAARTHLLEELRGTRYTQVLDRLVEAAMAPELTKLAGKPCEEVLPALVARAWKKLARRGRAMRAKAPDDDLHRVRIKAKRARYAAEAVATALGPGGKKAKRFATRCEAVQDVLGELQDAVVACELIEEFATDNPQRGPLDFALGRLFEREATVRERARAVYPKVWKDLDRPKNLKWLKR